MPHNLSTSSTLIDLAAAIGHDPQKLIFWATKAGPKIMYTPFEVKKRNGSARIIHAPAAGLKVIQRKLADWFATFYRPHAAAHGYIAGRSIITNALNHVDRREILTLDIERFFPSITARRIYGLLRVEPFNLNHVIASAIVRLTVLPLFHGEGIPQGAPSSAILSNMVMLRLDKKLVNLAKTYRCHYTRYADDISFSFKNTKVPSDFAACIDSAKRTIKIGSFINDLIEGEGFTINNSKTKIMSRSHGRQKVTGITVNTKPNIDRRYIRRIRAILHSLRTKGEISAQIEHLNKGYIHKKADGLPNISLKKIVVGMIAHVRAVKGHDDKVVFNLVRQFNDLPGNSKIRLPIAKHCVWKVLDRNYFSIGTAVSIQGIGLITCFHVVENDIKLYIQNDFLNERFEVFVSRSIPAIDLSLLSLKTPKRLSGLKYKTSGICAQGTAVDVYGFQGGGPNIGISISETTIRAIANILPPHKIDNVVTLNGVPQNVDTLRCLHLSGIIYGGGSGGPVIDKQSNEVVGIIYKGRTESSGDVDPAIAIPTHLLAVFKEAQIRFRPPVVEVFNAPEIADKPKAFSFKLWNWLAHLFEKS